MYTGAVYPEMRLRYTMYTGAGDLVGEMCTCSSDGRFETFFHTLASLFVGVFGRARKREIPAAPGLAARRPAYGPGIQCIPELQHRTCTSGIQCIPEPETGRHPEPSKAACLRLRYTMYTGAAPLYLQLRYTMYTGAVLNTGPKCQFWQPLGPSTSASTG